MYFFRSTLFVLATLFLSPANFAQVDSTGVYNNSLEKGSRSVQFRVTNNFNLTTFDGSDLSLKFHRSAKLAYRLGVGLNFGIDSDDSELTADNSFTRVRDTETTSNQFGLSINATRLKYFTPKKRMSFYWGAGPEVGFRFSDRDVNTNSTFEDSSMGISESSTQSIALNIGGILVFGTEFFLHKMISLTAEYRSRSAYTWTSEERDQIDTSSSGDVVNQNTSTTKHQVFIGSSSVLLGLSAYF